MRTNNGKVKNVIISIYFILIVLAIICTTLLSSFSDLYDNPTVAILMILAVFALLFFLTHRLSKYFEYDSDGMQVVIINKGLLLADYFNYREHKLEFEKEQLKGYKFRNYFVYRTLLIQLKDHKGRLIKERFNITFVNKKKRKYVRQSLNKIVKHNRKQHD